MTRNRSINQFQLILLAILCAAVLLPAFAFANQFKRIRDVNVSCNNALACDIYITNPRVTLQTFGFRRAASATADVAAYISMREPLQAGSEVQFLVDGKSVFAIDVAAFSYRAATYEYMYRDQNDVLALVNAARQGETLQIGYTTKAGRSTAPFSLSGLIAGLIYADEVQGRVGRSDALMAMTVNQTNGDIDGEGQAITYYQNWSDVPEPLLTYFGSDKHICSNEIGEPTYETYQGTQTSLEPDVDLISMPCGSPGAYNFPTAYWLKKGDAFQPLPVPIITQNGPSVEFQVWNSTWDGKTATLSSFYKGRGLGDCGTFSQWQLNNVDGNYAFVLKSMLFKENCDGVYKDDFADYKKVWPQQ